MDVPLKILIVAADEAGRATVRGALAGLGSAIFEAGDGAAGLSVLRSQTIDCAWSSSVCPIPMG